MSPLSVLTVASRRQLPEVHVLVASMRAAGVDAPVCAVIVDAPTLATVTDAPPGLSLVPPAMVEPSVVHQLRLLCRSGPELARALTPWVALGLLRSAGRPLVVVSPATWIGASLDVLECDGGSPAALVPSHLHSHPGTTWGRGFQRSCVAAQPDAEPLMEWWAEREVDRVLGLFGDWGLEEAAAAVEHAVIRDPGVGVDAWNAAEREVGGDGDRFTVVGGQPLRTFHFDDFDPLEPHLPLPAVGQRLPVLLSEHRALRRLHQLYAAALLDAGHLDARQEPYLWDVLPGGLPLDAAARHAYATALRAHRQGLGPPPPDPFSPGGLGPFVEFLNEPAPDIARIYSRYVWALYETWPLLPNVFPDVTASDRRHFVWWLNRYARADGPISSLIDLPALPTASWSRRADGRGINVAGYLRADSGLAVSARRTIAALGAAGVPVRPVTYARTMSRQEVGAPDSNEPLFDVNLVCVTAEQFPFFHADMGDEFFTGRYTIGYWYWELEVFPEDQLGALDLVDELWVATDHVRRAVVAHTTKPVRHMPIPLLEPEPSDRTRASFGLTDGYTFLFAFDFDSVMVRKHPLGVVAAFTEAFPEPGAPRLVLKSVNADRWPAEAELIRSAVADRPDAVLMDGYLSHADQAALVAVADCYVSLHRAEGLGLTLADAMALGKPVIATRYSGNLDFMDDENSFLVPFTYTSVPDGTAAYPAGAPWAEPDVTAAARYMRELASDPERGKRIGARARRDILARWTPARLGAQMRARLEEVWAHGELSRP
jgi:glycosyltransferase involved in cell wall biosynthesis